ncbi:hypothetical protein PV516_19265 [Streptomyces scabiei]|uniref:hypothetical protein n=1 Tax=Streptomyces scabiei TaxID=1930 RepID=UPI0029BA2169|nr:hypothetical protein [Streptomyces scabiei]MDX3165929.1 hypothetical protein [Streptomyces scabiei]
MEMTETQRTALHAARVRLTERFQGLFHQAAGVWPRRLRSQPLSPLAATSTLADAIEFEHPVEDEDLRAGLRLLPHARQSLNISEFTLLHRAHQRFTWEEIGALTEIGDRRVAHQRYTRLRKRLVDEGLWPEDADGTPTSHPEQ